MKPEPWNHVDEWRIKTGPYGTPNGKNYGAFLIPGPFNNFLKVIVSDGTLDPNYPFDHVSVSLNNRCPNWPEMDFIKHLFFTAEEWAYQLHAPPSKNISYHPYCLHIWRPLNEQIPIPPAIMVGPQTESHDAEQPF